MSLCNNPLPPSPLPGELECSGFTRSGTALFNWWNTFDCPGLFSTIVNTQITGDLGYNPVFLPRLQNDINQLFCTYLSTNNITDSRVDPLFNPFQDTLLAMCDDDRLPGGCDEALKNQVCSGVSRQQASVGRALPDFCGCYVPPDPVILASTHNEACDPLCHRASTVQKAVPETGQFIECAATICVINDVSISVNQSNVGGITFDQICGGCNQKNHPCECIISGTDVTTVLSNVGIGTQFSQLCGTNSVCLEIQADGTVKSLPCATFDPNNQPIPTFSSAVPSIVAIIIIVLAVLVVLAAVVVRYNT